MAEVRGRVCVLVVEAGGVGGGSVWPRGRERSLILHPSAACRPRGGGGVSQSLDCGRLSLPPPGIRLLDYASVSCSPISTRGEKLTLKSIRCLSTEPGGTDGGRGGTNPQECPRCLCGHLIVAETIVSCLFRMCATV